MNIFLVLAVCIATSLWALVFSIWIVREQKKDTSRVPIVLLWLIATTTWAPVIADLQFRRGITLEPQLAAVLFEQFLRCVLVFVAFAAVATRLNTKINKIFGILVILWGIAAVSTVLNGQSNISVWISILVALALGLNSSDAGKLFQNCRLILRTYIVMSLSVVLFFPASIWLTSHERYWAGIPQFVGLSSHPNGLGSIAALAVVLEAFGRMGGRFRWLFGSMAMTILLATQSRTGWLMAVIGLVGLVAVDPKSYRLRKTAIWTVSVVALVGLFFIFTSDLAQLNGLTTGRVKGWQIMASLTPATWFYGGGLEVLSDAFNSNKLSGLGSWSAQAHNQFLQTLLDSGVIGLIMLVTLYVVTLKQVLKSKGQDLSLKVALVGMLIVFSLTETPVRPSLGEISIFIFVCLLIISSTDPKHDAFRTSSAITLEGQMKSLHKA